MTKRRHNPHTSLWNLLTEKQKRELAWRYKNGLAIEVEGIADSTLRRYLRAWIKETGYEPEQDEGMFNVKESSTDANHASLTSSDPRITTLEELLAFCQVDLDVWEVERHVVNKWETPRKDVKKDIHWDGSGTIGDGSYVYDSGGMYVQQLLQVKAWLIRKKPVPVFPVITPVEMHVSYPHTQKEFSAPKGLETALIVPDTHFGFYRDLFSGELTPFHDRKVLSIALDIVASYKLDKIIFLGDMLDLPDFSDKFLRSPELTHTTQPAIFEAAWWLGMMRSAAGKKTEMYVLQGNHDVRLDNAIIKQIPAAYTLQSAQAIDEPEAWSIPSLLGLQSMGIEWVGDYPNGQVWINDTTVAVHGDIAGAPGTTAIKMLKDKDCNVIFGHIHRGEMASKTIYGRYGYYVVVAYTPGAACKVDGTVPGRKKDQQWSQGLALVHYTEADTNIIHIPINEGQALVNGTVYNSSNEELYLEMLREHAKSRGKKYRY